MEKAIYQRQEVPAPTSPSQQRREAEKAADELGLKPVKPGAKRKLH
jgi:hypothetical protein